MKGYNIAICNLSCDDTKYDNRLNIPAVKLSWNVGYNNLPIFKFFSVLWKDTNFDF